MMNEKAEIAGISCAMGILAFVFWPKPREWPVMGLGAGKRFKRVLARFSLPDSSVYV